MRLSLSPHPQNSVIPLKRGGMTRHRVAKCRSKGSCWYSSPDALIGLDAIAAAVLGGTGLSGGYGTILGTLVGALTIGVINNGILVAVYVDVLNKKRRT
jgi:hypothetical protein